MAFKTKEEMFGDGGGFGAAVPYSTTNPPGTGAGNRGVQFAEQLTAAIANRSHYALALNDEDLNDRLVIFESDGLDAAYDLGTGAVPGGGRTIDKDAGAVEVVTAHTTTVGDTVGDPAAYRANHVGDTVGIGVGYDVVSDRVGASGQSGNDGAAGFLDRRILAKAAGDTVLTNSIAACTLNPGGVVPDTVRLGAGKFHTTGETDLILGMDLIEVSGSAGGFDGYYITESLGATNADMIVRRLDGSTPSFTGNTACTVRVLRPAFATWGRYSARTVATGPSIVGTYLGLIPGAMDSTDTTFASAYALKVFSRDDAGGASLRHSIDFFGRSLFRQQRTALATDLDQNLDGGSYATRRFVFGDGDVGHIVTSDDATLVQRHDFLSLLPMDPAGLSPALTPYSVTMAYVAASPGTGEVRFNSAQDSDLWGFTPTPGTYIELDGSGLYYVAERTITGNGGFLLRCLDGSIPSHFPAAGTVTLVAAYSASVIGRLTSFDPTTLLDPGEAGITVRAGNILTAPTLENGVALALFASISDTDFLRCFVPSAGAVPGASITEKFKVSQTGEIFSASSITLGGSVTAAGSYAYATPPSRVTPVSLYTAKDAPGVANGWSRATNPTTSNTPWTSFANDAYLVFPLSEYLRDGQVLTDVKMVVNPGAPRAGGNRMSLALCHTDVDFVTPAIAAPTVVASDFDDTSTNLQTISLAAGLGGGHTVDRLGSNGRDYFVTIKAGNDAGTNTDTIHGLELTFSDPGPRSV